MMFEDKLKSLALDEGCLRVGIARRDAFSEAPPSADMRYLEPWAESVIAFAITTGTDWIEDYLGKKTRMVMRDNMHWVYHELYRISGVISDLLKSNAHKAHPIIPNGLYRPDHTPKKQEKVTVTLAGKAFTYNHCITVCSGPLKERKKPLKLNEI